MYKYRIAISTDPYHASIYKSKFYENVLKYDGGTAVKAVWCFCHTEEEGRRTLRQWALEAGGIPYDNTSIFEEEHITEKWYDGPGIYDPVSHECLYHFGADSMHQDIFTYELEENLIPLDIYERRVRKAGSLQELCLVMADAEKFSDLDAMSLINEYIEAHPAAGTGLMGLFFGKGFDFMVMATEDGEALCYSQQKGWFIQDCDDQLQN